MKRNPHSVQRYRCTMEVVSSGAQYRQDPYLWGTDLSPGGAKENEDCLQRENLASW